MTRLAVFGLVLLVLMSPVVVQAGSSLGSVQVDREMDAHAGDGLSFRVLFFNVHGEGDLELTLDSEQPEGWEISIPGTVNVPRTDIITGSPEAGAGYVLIRSGEGYIRARPVDVRVSVPSWVEPGSYVLKVSATVRGGDGMLSVSQSRSFSFAVRVEGETLHPEPEESVGQAEVSATQPEDVFVIDQDREVPDQGESEEKGNGTGMTEGVDGLVDSVTGSVTAYPFSYSVMVLVFALLLFGFLKAKKRI